MGRHHLTLSTLQVSRSIIYVVHVFGNISDSGLNEKVILVSMSVQSQLDFQLAELAPTGMYSRKNIGYLYAIACGATTIHETDDDNELMIGKLSDPW